MASFIKQLFVPTRFDAICFAVALHWIVAVFSVTLLPGYVQMGTLVESSLIVAVAAATWIAIAATVGWKANSKRGMLCLLISSVASLAFVVIWYCCNTELLGDSSFRVVVTAGQPTSEPLGFLLVTLWIALLGLVAAVAVWIVNLITQFALVRIGALVAKQQESSGENRTGWLIGVAAVLFVLAIAGRVVTSLSGLRQMVLSGLFFWLIVLFWFPRSYAFRRKPLQKAVSILLVAFIFVPFGMNLVFHGGNFSNVIALICGVVFVLSVIGIGGKEPRFGGGKAELDDVKSGPFPSLISLGAAILIGLFLAVPWFYDVSILANSVGGKSKLAEAVELSSKAAMINWKSGGRITPGSDQGSGVVLWQVQFDDEAPVDLLEVLEGAELSYIELRDLTPEFDLSALSGMVQYIKLTDCEVSRSQLSVLLGSAAWGDIQGEFSIVDDGADIKTGSFRSITFGGTKPGVIGEFFDAAKCEDQMMYTVVQTKVGKEDWPVIEKVAQAGSVYLNGGLVKGFRVPKSEYSLSRVHLSGYMEPTTGIDRTILKELILETDIQIGIPRNMPQTPEFAWKLLMLRGSAGLDGPGFNFRESGKSLAEFAKDVGMAFKVNDDGKIHFLYYPSGSAEVGLGVLKDLKVLSFDPAWIGGDSFRQRAEPFNTAHLSRMKSLEELYFEESFLPDDLSFLAELKSLKHLQIPSVVRKVTGAIGFDSCQSLESVTFLGIPDNKSYHEISRLKNLKRFVIVNVEEDPILSERYLEKLQEKLPEVDVKIVEPSDFETLIPGSFLDHRERIRRELREDTAWLDEALN